MTPDQKAREAAARALGEELFGLFGFFDPIEAPNNWRRAERAASAAIDAYLAALPPPADVEAVCERLEHPGALHGQWLENQREAATLIRSLHARLVGR